MPSPLVELPPAFAGGPLAHPAAVPWLRRAVLALLVLGAAAFLSAGGAQPADPYLAVSRVAGFDEGTLVVRVAAPASGLSPRELCALLATRPEQIARGMMTRRDLAGYAAMAFRFPAPTDALFYNRNVPIALSVAWFDDAGAWLGSKDLAPCPDREGCPTIAAPAPFRYVVEVPQGGLGALGLGPGSVIAVDDGC